jgi:restriction system protein
VATSPITTTKPKRACGSGANGQWADENDPTRHKEHILDLREAGYPSSGLNEPQAVRVLAKTCASAEPLPAAARTPASLTRGPKYRLPTVPPVRRVRKVPYDDPLMGWNAVNEDPAVWLEQMKLPPAGRSPWLDCNRFPTTAVRDALLSPGRSFDTKEVRLILRTLLPPGIGPVGSDVSYFEQVAETLVERVRSGTSTEYERRLLQAMVARKRVDVPAPIPDLSWVIDVALASPREALETIDAYLFAHFVFLNDIVIDGLLDAKAFVRRHLAAVPADPAALLGALGSRELECLTAALWDQMRYEVSLTPPKRDGGRDVIARETAAGLQQTVYIECKNWRRRVTVSEVRSLLGVLTHGRANKGVLVSPSGFTSGPGSARALESESPLLELLDGQALAALLGFHFGSDWPDKVDRLVLRGQRLGATATGNM